MTDTNEPKTPSPELLKKCARHVQREIEKDSTLKRPAYQWCLGKVREFWDAAAIAANTKDSSRFVEGVKRELLAMIKPLARKVCK